MLCAPLALAEEAGEEPKYGGTLVSYVSADPMNFDPATLTAWDQTIVAANILEGLVRLNPEGTGIEEGIAKEWSVSDDGLTWTFILREGAKFHKRPRSRGAGLQVFLRAHRRPGDRFRCSLDAQQAGRFRGVPERRGRRDHRIKVVDDYTLELTLSEPFAPFVSMLASASLAVVPQEAVEEYGEDFGLNVVSAGPFTLGEWNFNQDLTINAFEDYWGGRPYLDAVKFRVINDENTRIVEFDAGTLDIAWITPAHYDRIMNDPTYADSIGYAYTLHTAFLIFNMEQEPFASNKALREAVYYAMDTQAVLELLQYRASYADRLLLPGMLGGGEECTESPRNIELAKEKMAEAGYPDGIDEVFQVITPAWNNNIKILEIYQQNLKEIGINIEIAAMDNSDSEIARNNGQFKIAWGNVVATYPDSDAMIYPTFHSSNIGAGGNFARYSNPEVDALIDQARASTSDEERAELYHQIDDMVLEDLPYAYLDHNIYVDVCQPYVKNYCPSALDVTTYHRVWLDK